MCKPYSLHDHCDDALKEKKTYILGMRLNSTMGYEALKNYFGFAGLY